MLLDPGPLTHLDADRLLEPVPSPDLESFVASRLGAVSSGIGVLSRALDAMGADLAAFDADALTAPLDAAIAAHEGAAAAPLPDFARDVSHVDGTQGELDALAGQLPPDTGAPEEPGDIIDQGDRFDSAEPIDLEALQRQFDDIWRAMGQISTGGGGPGPGGGGDPGGGPPVGAGGYIDGTEELLRAYMDRFPDQRDRIEAFLRSNPGDYGRAPRALELPSWNSFVRNYMQPR
jgi:hypothetical protein